jgi:fibro-slime domain-containing protein
MSANARTCSLVIALAGLAAPVAAQPSAFVLRGTIRDFKSDHPDFGPGIAGGHHAGNLDMKIGDDEKPGFSGAGYAVTTQWRDRLARPIAPHMWNDGRVFVEVATSPSISSSATVDSYDSELGPYSSSTAGPAPEWLTGSPMPGVTVPSLAVPMTATFFRNGGGTTTLNTDLRCQTFDIRNSHRIRIEGHVRIVCETKFEMRDGARIELAPGASCDIYILGSATINDTTVGGPQQTHRLRIYKLGTAELRLGDAAQIHGHFTAPSAKLKLQDGSQFFGKVRAQTVEIEDSSGLHIDDVPSLCGILIDDSRGAGGSAGGGITSAATFSQWYHDAIGVNASRPHSIVLRDTTGLYEFDSGGGFFPIDGKLYGDEGDPHNYYFTYEIRATFTYTGCADQTIWFEGSDDCWIYIDDELVIDLGGVEADTGQVVEVDRLRLQPGETYAFRLFYAHRNAGTPRFNLRTNFELMPEPVESGIAGYPAHD